MEAAAIIGVGASLLGAYGTYQSGKIQQKLAGVKARIAELQAGQSETNEKRKALNIMEKMGAYAATINARSAAGSIDAASGTPAMLKTFAYGAGTEDLLMVQDNAELIQLSGILTAIDARQAGAQAMYQARIGALSQIGQAAFSAAMIGGGKPPSPTPKGSVTYGQGTYFYNSGMGGIT